MDILHNTVQAFINSPMPEHEGLEHGPPTEYAIQRMIGCVEFPRDGIYTILTEEAITRRNAVIAELREFFQNLVLPWDMLTVNIFQNVIARHNWYE